MNQDTSVSLGKEGEPKVTELLSPVDSLDWQFSKFQIPLKNVTVGGAIRKLLCIVEASKRKKLSISNLKEDSHVQEAHS